MEEMSGNRNAATTKAKHTVPTTLEERKVKEERKEQGRKKAKRKTKKKIKKKEVKKPQGPTALLHRLLLVQRQRSRLVNRAVHHLLLFGQQSHTSFFSPIILLILPIGSDFGFAKWFRSFDGAKRTTSAAFATALVSGSAIH
jgi:hypothetical protein